MNVINVNVTTIDPEKLKVVWANTSSRFPAYILDRKMVIRASENVRKKLYSFINSARVEGIKNIDQQFKELAIAGHRLYRTIFLPELDTIIWAEKIKEWLPTLAKPIRIHFIVDNRIQIPWGLIYESDPEEIELGFSGIELLPDGGFWCDKYSLTAIYRRIMPPSNETVLPQDIQLFPIFNESVFNKNSAGLIESEKEGLELIFRRFSDSKDPIFTSGKFWDSCGARKNNSLFFYFCCHASKNTLELGITDLISIDDLKLKFNSIITEDDICLSFFNGCSTSEGHKDGGFIEASSQRGLYGFIGTETKVPDQFAFKFGIDFLSYFFHSGKPIFELMQILRKKHWPLSLVYGVYCYPLLRVEKNPLENSNFVSINNNLSLERLGSDEL